jgi:hypothetical protein
MLLLLLLDCSKLKVKGRALSLQGPQQLLLLLLLAALHQP